MATDLSFVFERFLPISYMATLVLALLMRGSAEPLQGNELGGLMGVISFIAVTLRGEPKSAANAFRLAIAICGVLVAWVILQTIPIPKFANPAWAVLDGLGVTRAGTVSIAPADSRAAIVFLALPFVTFIGALCIFPSDQSAERLLSFVGYLGGALAFFAICQFMLDDSALMFGEKRFYAGSLTAPFVNRNTAGTFYGLVSLVLAARAFIAMRKVDFAHLMLGAPRNPERERLSAGHILLAACFVASLVALFLTRSRGAVGSTFAAFILFVPLLATVASGARTSRYGVKLVRKVGFKRLLVPVSAFASVVLVGLIFADRALFRAEVQGLEDGRFCVAPAILKAIKENQWTGTGFGTFRAFFPALRDPLCGISFIWDKAHNVYLEAYLGLGAMFAAVCLVGLVALVIIFVKGVSSRRRKRAYPLLGLASLVLVAAHSAIDFSLQIPGFAVIFAAVTAGLVTISMGGPVR